MPVADTTRPAGPDDWIDGQPRASAVDGVSALEWPRTGAHDDPQHLQQQLRQVVAAGDGAQRRIFATYVSARAALGVVLLAMHLLQAWPGGRVLGWAALICTIQATQALACWARPSYRSAQAGRIVMSQWWATVAVDAVVFSLLHWLETGASLNYAALLVLPAMMAGVLCTWVPALATTSAMALAVLAVASQRVLAGAPDGAGQLMQAGLVGAGLFVVTLVAGEMASWVAREERTALGSLGLAHQQAELNRLVIDEMAEGVMVVDRDCRVRVANPAARALLAEGGACPPAPFSLHVQPGWRALLLSVERAFVTGHWPAAGTDLTVSFADEVPRSLRMRARFTHGVPADAAQQAQQAQALGEELAVVFLEELRSVEARQRQERLVAMGRISASIAHEIRNPLAAVSQANALLLEDDPRPDQRWLGRIIADNVERLKRIVDDVLEAAPAGSVSSPPIELVSELAGICEEWTRTVGVSLQAPSPLDLQLPPAPLPVFFDPHHLRRVLVNLLDNAFRHCANQAGSMAVSLEGLDAEFLRLSVASDGELIAPEVERHLFEPFHSTRSRGTGLGLYICRELCQRHGAIIDYLRRPGARHGNVFLIVLRRVGQPDAPHPANHAAGHAGSYAAGHVTSPSLPTPGAHP